jgi:hypothetical protein
MRSESISALPGRASQGLNHNVLAIALRMPSASFKLEWLESFLRFSPEVAYRRVEELAAPGEEASHGVWVFVRFRLERHRPEFHLRLERRLRVLLRRIEGATPLRAGVWGWGFCPEHAESVARFGRSEFFEDTPVAALECFGDAFARDDDDARAWRMWRTKSESLGYRTLSDLFEIPQSAFLRRFGERPSAWLLRARMVFEVERSGGSPSRTPWPKIVWPETIEEAENCPEGVFSVDAMIFGLKPLLEKMSARLYSRRLRVARLGLQIHTADSKTRVWEFAFPLPQTTGHGVLGIVRERLARELELMPLRDEVTRFEVRVLEALPARVREREFWNSPETDREPLDHLVLKLNQRIAGAKQNRPRAFFAKIEPHDWPEHAWRRVLDRPEENSSPDDKLKVPRGGIRPLRVFPQPERGDAPSLVALEPEVERIVGEWWRSSAASSEIPVIDVRDYRVHRESREWWFRSGQGWFRHGSFD